MKRTILSLIFISVSSLIFAQGIEFFHGTWEEALNEAQKEDKIIFVDAYAKWCGPCKKMARDVFTLENVGSFFNANFINIKMDMEEQEGISFGRSYPVSAFPTLFFLDSEGNILKKVVGGQPAEGLLSLASIAIKSYDKTDQFAEKYEAGNRDFDLVLGYVRELNKMEEPSGKIANDYMNSQPDITDAQKAEFLLASVLESDSKLYDQLIELKSQAINSFSKEEFEDCIVEAVFKTIEKSVEYDYEDLYHQALANFEKADISDKKQFEMEAGLYYNALRGNYSDWEDLSKKFLKKYGKKNTEAYKEHINQLKKYFNYVEGSKEYLYSVCEDLIKAEGTPQNYMLYLGFLMNDMNYTKAKEWCAKALDKHKDSFMGGQFNQMFEFLQNKA